MRRTNEIRRGTGRIRKYREMHDSREDATSAQTKASASNSVTGDSRWQVVSRAVSSSGGFSSSAEKAGLNDVRVRLPS